MWYPEDAPMAELFDLARKLTNSTKHFKQAINTRTTGAFGEGFSDGFDTLSMFIVLKDDTEMSVDSFLKELVEFWKAKGFD